MQSNEEGNLIRLTKSNSVVGFYFIKFNYFVKAPISFCVFNPLTGTKSLKDDLGNLGISS